MSYHQPDAASAILAGFCLRARLMHRESARPAGGFWRGMPTPSLPPKRALAPPPRLRAKCVSFCALCADRPGPASAGAARQKRRFKNCANLCKILHSLSPKKARVLAGWKSRIQWFGNLIKPRRHYQYGCANLMIFLITFNGIPALVFQGLGSYLFRVLCNSRKKLLFHFSILPKD